MLTMALEARQRPGRPWPTAKVAAKELISQERIEKKMTGEINIWRESKEEKKSETKDREERNDGRFPWPSRESSPSFNTAGLGNRARR